MEHPAAAKSLRTSRPKKRTKRFIVDAGNSRFFLSPRQRARHAAGAQEICLKSEARLPLVGLSPAVVLPISVLGHQWASISTDKSVRRGYVRTQSSETVQTNNLRDSLKSIGRGPSW